MIGPIQPFWHWEAAILKKLVTFQTKKILDHFSLLLQMLISRLERSTYLILMHSLHDHVKRSGLNSIFCCQKRVSFKHFSVFSFWIRIHLHKEFYLIVPALHLDWWIRSVMGQQRTVKNFAKGISHLLMLLLLLHTVNIYRTIIGWLMVNPP